MQFSKPFSIHTLKYSHLLAKMAVAFNFHQFWKSTGFLLLVLAIQNSNGDTVDLKQEDPTHIIVDNRNDFSKHWETDCVAVDDYNYFWAFGCENNNAKMPVAENSATGYWSTCSASKCRVRYTGLPEDMIVSEITVHGFVGGNSRIAVTGQTGLAGSCSNCLPIAHITSNSDTIQSNSTTLANVNPTHRVLNFEIVSVKGTVAILDKFEIKLAKKPEGGEGGEGGQGGGQEGGSGGGDAGGDEDGSNSAGIIQKSLYFQIVALFCYLFY